MSRMETTESGQIAPDIGNKMEVIDVRIVRTLRAAKRYLMYNDDEFLELLKDRYGVSIIDDLTGKQGEDLLAYCRSAGFGKPEKKWTCTLCVRRPMKGPDNAGVIIPPTNAQYSIINVLKEAVQWGHLQGFEKWLFKYFGLTEIKCGQHATMVITALKGVIRSQKKRCTGCKWQFDIDPADTNRGNVQRTKGH